MKSKAHTVLLFFIFFITAVRAQEPQFKLFLVGDAGDEEMTGETLDSLKSKLLQNPQSAILFMGDNSYRDHLGGLIPGFKGFDSSTVTQNKLKSQFDILNGYKGAAYFVPGNHDWWNITNFSKGKKKLKMEESFIETTLSKNSTIKNPDSTFLPRNGTPGPVSVELNNKKVRIIFIDSYWLILLAYKNNPSENLTLATKFYHLLDSTLAAATTLKQTIFVVAHHPVYTTTSSPPKPLKHPFLFARVKQSNKQFPSYKNMADSINNILKKYPGVYYASGHLHALQYHMVNNVHYIVSGAGSKTKYAKGANTTPCNTNDCALWNEKGFFEIDFYSNRTDVIMYHDSGKKSCNLSQTGGCN